MSHKVTLRIEEHTYNKLYDKHIKYGYRSFSSYLAEILEQRTVVEIAGGDELTTVIHQIRTTNIRDLSLRKEREKLCQSFASLTTEIEKMRNCAESYNT